MIAPIRAIQMSMLAERQRATRQIVLAMRSWLGHKQIEYRRAGLFDAAVQLDGAIYRLERIIEEHGFD
jgi:hypothetical protein